MYKNIQQNKLGKVVNRWFIPKKEGEDQRKKILTKIFWQLAFTWIDRYAEHGYRT